MNFLRALVGFFTDDLSSALALIIWTVMAWLAERVGMPRSVLAPLYAIGVIAILGISIRKRITPKS
jgi:hypothetical protein